MLKTDMLVRNRYRIVRLIAAGRMGAVYLAHDHRLGHEVALKKSLFNDDLQRQVLEREATLLSTLRHPVLPKFIDQFADDHYQILIMDFIPGLDLAAQLQARGSAFPREQVLIWADQLLDALQYVHAQAIIHRDIKPANLKLSEQGRIFLLDFGVAVSGNQSLTISYPASYASPEQILGAPIDPRSDLYSLALTLCHLLTGVEPPDAVARLTAISSGQPDPLLPAHEVDRSQIAPAVKAVLMRALSLKPERRFVTAAEMRKALWQAGRVNEADRIPKGSDTE